MNFCNSCSNLKIWKGILTLLVFLFSQIVNSQLLHSAVQDFNVNSNNLLIQENTKKGVIGLELSASINPKARITKDQGNYNLKSHLQSAFTIGVNYLRYLNSGFTFSSGLHFVIGKRNFFLDVPNEDVSQYVSDGRKIVESKELWGALRVPLVLEKKISSYGTDNILVKAGLSFRYSGLMTDLVMEGGGFIDSNNQVTRIFSGFFSGKNNYKPWVTFIVGVGKMYTLNNKNNMSFCLSADISTTYFYRGTYEITIPGQPVTSGTYKINGTSLGLSVQYVFTGYNKRKVKEYLQN